MLNCLIIPANWSNVISSNSLIRQINISLKLSDFNLQFTKSFTDTFSDNYSVFKFVDHPQIPLNIIFCFFFEYYYLKILAFMNPSFVN